MKKERLGERTPLHLQKSLLFLSSDPVDFAGNHMWVEGEESISYVRCLLGELPSRRRKFTADTVTKSPTPIR